MPANQPITEKMPANKDYGPPFLWDEGRHRLAEMDSYWLATSKQDGVPHVRPVLAVWLDGAMYFSSKETAHKGRNLARDGRCILSATSPKAPSIDMVVEGSAARVTDPARLQRVADVYASKYDWHVTVRDGRFDAEYGAPTAGEPPYTVFELTPSVVFAFPGVGETDDSAGSRGMVCPTRWRF